MTTVARPDADPLTTATALVASSQHAAPSALQRWMGISFREAADLLDAMHQRGLVGPADGSKARDVFVRRCEQCGRVGRRGFQTLANEEQDVPITVCANKVACRRRWPKPSRDEA
ncbi:DNA translocase FtsK [Streptomyces nigra]|uniref:DNA translocase FtsK n=1 Tax=Streptomyces nigra TaxID=1827580 RepID=UPI00368F868C